MSITGERSWSRVSLMDEHASCFTFAWLATHRDRLRTILLRGNKLSVIVVWDRLGDASIDHPAGEVDAMRTIVYGPSKDENERLREALAALLAVRYSSSIDAINFAYEKAAALTGKQSCACDPPRSVPGAWVAHQPGCPERERLRATQEPPQ